MEKLDIVIWNKSRGKNIIKPSSYNSMSLCITINCLSSYKLQTTISWYTLWGSAFYFSFQFNLLFIPFWLLFVHLFLIIWWKLNELVRSIICVFLRGQSSCHNHHHKGWQPLTYILGAVYLSCLFVLLIQTHGCVSFLLLLLLNICINGGTINTEQTVTNMCL